MKAFAALAATGLGVFWAVLAAFHAGQPTVGVAAADASRLLTATRVVHVAGVAVSITHKASGDLCYSAPGVQSCTSMQGSSRLSYATGRSGGRPVVAGVAGTQVRAVILKLSGLGTVWPKLVSGVFYTVLPQGRHLRAVVKVLPGGHRVTFTA